VHTAVAFATAEVRSFFVGGYMHKIIAAVRSRQDLAEALVSGVSDIFLLKTDIMELQSVVEKVHAVGKSLFVHMDFADGVGKDTSGCLFLKSLGVDGIISTRANIIKSARENGMKTVQRVFIVDSHSIVTAADTMQKNLPDMIELMPGIAAKAISFFRDRVTIPVIAGGLIETEEEVKVALDSGASAVSTGKRELWK